MDSFIFFLEIYRKYSNRRVAIDIYRGGGLLASIGLWLGKLVFFASSVSWYFATQHVAESLALMLCGAGLWGLSFSRAIRRYLSSVPNLSRNKASLFSLNYQYLRYHFFSADVRAANRESEASKALAFLNGLLETEHSASVWSNPFITTMLAVSLAVLGGAAGGWGAKYVIGTIFFSVVAMYFAAMFLAVRTSKDASMKELKRFLLWLVDETEGRSPSLQLARPDLPIDVSSTVQKNMGISGLNPSIAARAETGQKEAA